MSSALVEAGSAVDRESRRAIRRRGLRTALRFLLGRLAQGALVVAGAILIGFVLVNLSGSGVAARSGGMLTPEQIAELKERLGYDEPLIQRLGSYLADVARGDFGDSYRYNDSALSLVIDALPNTLVLVTGALLLALVMAVPAAIYSAHHRGSVLDRVLRVGSSFMQGLPEFWLALMLVLGLSVKAGIFPSVGYESYRALALPTIALAIPVVPALFRLLRAELMTVMNQDFVDSLRIRGIDEGRIVRTHALRNAWPSFLTFMSLQIGYLLGGTILVEVVFGWPGIGSLAVGAANAQDVAIVEAVVVVLAVAYVLLNLVADVLVLILDPRVRTGRL